MDIGLKELGGTVYAGLLSLLWWDIRSIRKERDQHRKAIDESLGEYLLKEKHEDLCKITILETMNKVERKIDETKDEILEAIKQQ